MGRLWTLRSLSTVDARFEGVQSYIGMRMNLKRIICFTALVAMLGGCNGIGNPEGDLKDIKLEEWPLTDCSTKHKAGTGPRGLQAAWGSIQMGTGLVGWKGLCD